MKKYSSYFEAKRGNFFKTEYKYIFYKSRHDQ